MSNDNANNTDGVLERATDIVAAFVSNNSLPIQELVPLIQAVHATLTGLANGRGPVAIRANVEPAVPIKKSVTDDFIICLEDGKKFQSLKRHLRATYSMSPEEYRTKWGLPFDYPMVAPNYSSRRSQIAKNMGLGATRSTKGKTTRTKSKPTPS